MAKSVFVEMLWKVRKPSYTLNSNRELNDANCITYYW
jgi:hypothetical protein